MDCPRGCNVHQCDRSPISYLGSQMSLAHLGFKAPKFQKLQLVQFYLGARGILKAAHQVQARNFRNHCSFHPKIAHDLIREFLGNF